MARNLRWRFPLAASLLAAPVLLALGGCMAVPVAELAAPGISHSLLAGAMQNIVPGMTSSRASPCASGQQTNGCGTNARPDPNPTDSQDLAVAPDHAACSAGSDCGGNTMDRLLHNLTQSLQQLSPSALLQH